ncbi:LAMI_0H03950g1_1 [Lachancea mirantina]|uniref:Heat shock transcription factor n=1 Tax=Lachancea mirantina TaxID=1230905 RepID=A0A1G4KEM1_9SACH|nr:LAMI_0H03950g1_1 [Lachancea mirantina]
METERPVHDEEVRPKESNGEVKLENASSSVEQESQAQPQQQWLGVVGQHSNAPYSNTAFIRKLYAMLEDREMRELIWWSPSETSFLIRPNEKFSKALAAYFKHSNVSSFVRQLNMYGFHKVNDHTGSRPAASTKENEGGESMPGVANADDADAVNLWEFKHSSGVFRRGDMESLKLIKRRHSRNHNSARKSSLSTASTPGENNERASNEIWNDQATSKQNANYDVPQSHPIKLGPSTHPIPTPGSGVFYAPPTADMHDVHHQMSTAHVANVPANMVDNYALQLRYEHTVEDIRHMNMDMIRVIDLVHNVFTAQNQPDVSQNKGDHSSKSDEQSVPHPRNKDSTGASRQSSDPHDQRCDQLIAEITKVKNSILTRMRKSFGVPPPHRYSQPVTQDVAGPHPYPLYMPGRYSVPEPPTTNRGVVASHSIGGSQPNLAGVPHPLMTSSVHPPVAYTNNTQTDYFSSGNPVMPGMPPPYLMMNPFEQKTSNSAKNRNMSVLMDPLAPAPLLQAASVVSGAPSPTLNEQHRQQQMYQHINQNAHQNFSGSGASHAIPRHSRQDSRADVRMASGPGIETRSEIKMSEKRPLSPSYSNRMMSSSPGRGHARAHSSSVAYKSMPMYGPVAATGAPTPALAHGQYPLMAPQGLVPHHSVVQHQIGMRTVAYPPQRGPSPLNPAVSEHAEAQKIGRPTPVNLAEQEDPPPKRRDDRVGSSSSLHTLLNNEINEPRTKKTKS